VGCNDAISFQCFQLLDVSASVSLHECRRVEDLLAQQIQNNLALAFAAKGLKGR
jgi:hypothetical protein